MEFKFAEEGVLKQFEDDQKLEAAKRNARIQEKIEKAEKQQMLLQKSETSSVGQP